MLRELLTWLDERTEYRRLWLPIRRRMLPGGPRWEYSTASCLLWLMVVEAVTGFLLMVTYSPSTTSAWASVHYIEDSPSGSFIRGLHHYAAHALLIMFAVHTIRVLLQAGFRPPRTDLDHGLVSHPTDAAMGDHGQSFGGHRQGHGPN